MNKFTFKKLQKLLELDLDKKYASYILEIIKNSDCLFNPGIIMPKEHIASLYRLRFEIAKERSSLGQEYLKDYERTVTNLSTSLSENLCLTGLYTSTNSFLIFFEPVNRKILGILKSTSNDQTVAMVSNLNEAADFEKYSKGQLV